MHYSPRQFRQPRDGQRDGFDGPPASSGWFGKVLGWVFVLWALYAVFTHFRR